MKQATTIMTALVFVSALATGSVQPADKTIMTGSYETVGEYPDTGEIEAVFTPGGEGGWSVVFHFDFQGIDYTFSGEAEGRLTDGPLEGTVTNASGERTFTFRGSVTDGSFNGTHAEVEYGGETPTGIMTLTASPEP